MSAVGDRLIVRLRALGLDIPDGARIRNASVSAGWAFSVEDADGGDSLKIGSAYSATVLMREPRLVAACPSWAGLTRILRWRPEWDDADPSTFNRLLIEPPGYLRRVASGAGLVPEPRP